METPPRDLPHLFIVRPAPEILLKASGTRRRFEQTLRANLKAMLQASGIAHALDMDEGRILLSADRRDETLDATARVFGVASVSPVDRVMEGDLESFCATAVELYADLIGGRSYAVRVKCIGRRLFSSQDLERQIGAALNPFGKVDLSHPDVTVRLDIRGHKAMFHAQRREGQCGFPLGIQGRVAALVSGGFDSVAAAWMLMRRGAAMEFVFCNLAGGAYERSVVEIVKTLTDRWGAGMEARLHVVDLRAIVADLRASCDPEFWQVVLKRQMYRMGCQMAHRLHCEAIVTGEALGQVSSQTLSNLNSIDVAADLPVLRPLIGFEKRDIVTLTRMIGTAHLSEKVPEYCALNRRRPAVKSRIGQLDREEAKMNPALFEQALQSVKFIDLNNLSSEALAQHYVLIDALPEGARLIDMQTEDEYETWHPEGVRWYNAGMLLGEMERFERTEPLVLYCGQGTQSAVLAEHLQQAGYAAYSLRGGTRALRKLLDSANG
ncbi:tRNA 4-thiouridine(8) synthase ThiI [Magnetospira thiophila]